MNFKSFALKSSSALLVTAFLILSSQAILQAQSQVQREAKVIEVNGKAEILRSGQTAWSSARKGSILKIGDSLKTSKNASAVIEIDGVAEPSMINVASNTEVKMSDLGLDEQTGTESTLIDLAIGDVLVDTKPKAGSQFQVKTPTSIVGARGTAFRVKEY